MFRSKWTKHTRIWTTFGRSDAILCERRKGSCESFVAFSKTMAGVEYLKRIWTDASGVARVVQETCSSEMLGGQGADFLTGLAFRSIRSVVLGR